MIKLKGLIKEATEQKDYIDYLDMIDSRTTRNKQRIGNWISGGVGSSTPEKNMVGWDNGSYHERNGIDNDMFWTDEIDEGTWTNFLMDNKSGPGKWEFEIVTGGPDFTGKTIGKIDFSKSPGKYKGNLKLQMKVLMDASKKAITQTEKYHAMRVKKYPGVVPPFSDLKK